MNDFFYMLIFLLVVVSSRLLHEWAHYRRAKVLGSDPKFYFGWLTMMIKYDEKNKLSNKEEISVLNAGIITGLIPLLILPLLNYGKFFISVAFLLYLWACVPDIKKVWRLYHEKV